MPTIVMLQKRIVKALEQGKDTAPLLKELRDLRAELAGAGELDALQKVVDDKQELRDIAKEIKAKVKAQSDGIDSFLEMRDTIVALLQPIAEPMNKLALMGNKAWEREPGVCYAGYNDYSQFATQARNIPQDYLDKDIGCPFLSMVGGQIDVDGKANEALQYFVSVLGILAGFEKTAIPLSLKPAEGLMSETEGSCIVCDNPDLAKIDEELKAGVSLRDLEAKHGVSRSSLSRHKANCLNLGVIREV